jgi:hypothetical protein
MDGTKGLEKESGLLGSLNSFTLEVILTSIQIFSMREHSVSLTGMLVLTMGKLLGLTPNYWTEVLLTSTYWKCNH